MVPGDGPPPLAAAGHDVRHTHLRAAQELWGTGGGGGWSCSTGAEVKEGGGGWSLVVEEQEEGEEDGGGWWGRGRPATIGGEEVPVEDGEAEDVLLEVPHHELHAGVPVRAAPWVAMLVKLSPFYSV